MIDRFIYKCCDVLDKYSDWMNNIFFSKPKKKKKTESEKMQEELEPIGILKRAGLPGRWTSISDFQEENKKMKKRNKPVLICGGMPLKNMVSIMAAVAVGVYGYFELTARLTSLETSRELFQADLLKKSEQLPTDQEQFMLIENLYKVTEKLEITQEQNMTNKVNIQFLNKQLEKALIDVEKLKDKVRKNGNGSHD